MHSLIKVVNATRATLFFPLSCPERGQGGSRRACRRRGRARRATGRAQQPRTVRKEGRWAEGGLTAGGEGRGEGRVTKADRHMEPITPGNGVGVHLGIKKHLAVSGTEED